MMNTRYILAAIVSLGMGLPLCAHTQTHVGSNKGRFSVSSAGEASFQIPIPVPPGIRKQQPKLNFSYSSGTPNGLLGVGWSLSGFPKVSRVKKIIEIDGVAGSITFTNQDRFALDGQRLLVMSGQNGDDASRYRTEIDGWRRVVASGVAGTGPESFTVTRADGTQMVFGKTADARPATADGATAREWLLSEVTDRNGNTMRVTYSQSPNGGGTSLSQTYPVEIAYGTNVAGPADADRFVRLGYENRPDPHSHFLAGTEVRTDLRLATVSTYLGADLVSQFRLSYDTSAANGRSRLTSIQRFASADTSAEGMAPTTFGYSDGSNSFDGGSIWIATAFTSGSGWDQTENPVTLADVNGDGLNDIIGFRSGTQVALGTPTQFAAPTVWISDFSPSFNWTPDQPRYLADINGDGLADIVGFSDGGVVTALADAQNSQFIRQQGVFPHFSSNAGWNSGAPRYLADVNGDGAIDIVGMDDGVTVALANGQGGFDTPTTWNPLFGTRQGFDAADLLIVDMNGDGKGDVVAMDQRSRTIGVALSTGSSFTTNGWQQNYQNFASDLEWGPDNPRMFSDVNGDGLADIVGFSTLVQVGLSNGAGFEPPQTWSTDFGAPNWDATMPRMMMDVNADGMADVVGVGNSNVQIALSDGSAFVPAQWNQASLDRLSIGQGGAASDGARIPVDVNADGMTDLVGFTAAGVVVGLVSGDYPDLMNTLTRGTAGQVQIGYAPISDPDVYSETPGQGALAKFQKYRPINQNGALPVYRSASRLTGHFYVVRDNTATNNPAIAGRDFAYRVTHRYKDGATSNLGRGWLGFGETSHDNSSMNRTTTITYNQKFPLVGRPSEKSLVCMAGATVCAAGEIYHEDVFDYATPVSETSATTGLKATMVQVKAIRSDRFQGTRYMHSLGQTFEYDAFSNQTQIANLNLVDRTGRDLDPADNVYDNASYSGDTAGWFLNYPLFQKTSASPALADIGTFVTDTDISLKRHTYGPEMNQTGLQEWDDENGAFVGNTFTYDAFGNRTGQTAPNGGVTAYAVDPTYRTYEVTQVSPPNAQGRHLTTQFGHDARFGTRALKVDPNGNVTTICHDEFGRRATLQGPLPASADQSLAAASCLGADVVAGVAPPAQTLVDLVTYDHAWETGIATVRETALQSWQIAGGAPQTQLTVTYYDGMDRDYRVITQAEDGSLTQVNRDETFNAAHDVVESLLPYFTTDTAPDKVTQTFDPLDRSIANTAPWTTGGTTTTVDSEIAYAVTSDGEVVTRTEAKGTPYETVNMSDKSYFENDAQTVREVFEDTGRGGSELLTGFLRDLVGRVTRLSPPGADAAPGHVQTCATAPDGTGPNTDLHAFWAYDSLNRVCSKRLPSLGTIRYLFGTDALLSTKTTNTGTTQYTYDALGRQLSATHPGGITVTKAWDNPASGANGLGQLASAKVTGQVVPVTRSYGYDAYGRENDHTLDLGQGGAALSGTLDYDPVGRPVRHALSDGTTLDLTLRFGNTTAYVVNGTTQVSASDFTAFGHPRSLTFGNGVTTNQTFGADFQVASIATTAPDGTMLVSETYARDPFGFVLDVQGKSHQWPSYQRSYDYLSKRMVSASDSRVAAPGPQAASYDTAGNLEGFGPLQATTQGYVLDASSTFDGAPLQPSYDPVGSLTGLGAPGVDFTGTYDGRDRLAQATFGGGTADFAYDHTGFRVYRKDASGTEHRYLSPMLAAIGAGDDTEVTLHGPMGPAWVARTSGGKVQSQFWLHADDRRSVVVQSDAGGTAAESYLYNAYGVLDPSGGTPPPYGFNGQRLDADSGFYVYAARYYDPRMGRFTRADTQFGADPERHDAANRYAFLLNNPQFGFDPSGHGVAACVLPLLGGTGGLAAGGTNIYLGVKNDNLGQSIGVGGGAAIAGGASVLGGIFGCINIRNELQTGQRLARMERALDNQRNRIDEIDLQTSENTSLLNQCK